MEAPRFVMIRGVCPGIGKSTLSEHLTESLRDRGAVVDQIPEEDIFVRPEFSAAADGFRSGRGANDESLIWAYTAIVEQLKADQAWAVFDWSCADMVEDLAWAVPEVVVHHCRQVREIAADLDPIVLTLEGEIDEAVARAVAERGEPWVERYANLAGPGVAGESPVTRIIKSMTQNQKRNHELLNVLDQAGWTVISLDPMARPSEVRDMALSVLLNPEHV